MKKQSARIKDVLKNLEKEMTDWEAIPEDIPAPDEEFRQKNKDLLSKIKQQLQDLS